MNHRSSDIERNQCSDGRLPSVPVLESDHPLGTFSSDNGGEEDEDRIADTPTDTLSNFVPVEDFMQQVSAPASNLQTLKDIFPDVETADLVETLQDCDNDLDRAVVNILDKSEVKLLPNKSNTIHRSASAQSIPQPSQDYCKPYEHTALSSKPHRSLRKKLPSAFLQIPQARTMNTSPSTMDPGQCISYTVKFNRKECSLDINVKQVKNRISVNGLYINKDGLPGLSRRAGVEIGDVLCGINNEYFDSNITLKQVTTIVAASGQYITLHFLRFAEPGLIPAYIDGSCPDPTVQLRKIHPCALVLLDQEVLEVQDIEVFCDTLVRIKDRSVRWGTGMITHRSRVRDVLQATYGMRGEEPASKSGGSSRQSVGGGVSKDAVGTATGRRHRRASVSGPSLSVNRTSSVALSAGNSSDFLLMGGDIRQHWYSNVCMNTVDLRPALFMCITGTAVVDAHQEYIIRVEDVCTGLEWFVRRRYKEFYRLREVSL